MLKIEIVDDSCAEGEAYTFKVPIETDWNEIGRAVKLLYPHATSVSLLIEVEG